MSEFRHWITIEAHDGSKTDDGSPDYTKGWRPLVASDGRPYEIPAEVKMNGGNEFRRGDQVQGIHGFTVRFRPLDIDVTNRMRINHRGKYLYITSVGDPAGYNRGTVCLCTEEA